MRAATGRGRCASTTPARRRWSASWASSRRRRRARPTRRCCRRSGDHPIAKVQGSRVGGPPLVGRAPEWARLTALWRATERGRAQLVLVTGEPGIGKSRLVEEFRAWCAHRGAVTAEARSYPAEGALAYGPVVAWLRSEALAANARAARPAAPDRARAPAPRTPLDGARPRPPGAAARGRAAAAAVRRHRPGDPRVRGTAPARRRRPPLVRPRNAAVPPLPAARRAGRPPARRGDGAARGARPPPSPARPPRRSAGPGALHRDRARAAHPSETAALAERVAGRPFAEPDADRLYGETEGNPLFVVEALRAGWHERAPARRVAGPKVQAVIESRLAQLSEPARDLVGLAATIGREFTTDVLASARAADEETLVRGLDELWRRRIVREQGVDAYDFSHDKIREVAYLAPQPRAAPPPPPPRRARAGAAPRRRPGTGQRATRRPLRARGADRPGHRLVRAGGGGGAAAARERRGGPPPRPRARPPPHASGDRPERQARELALLTALPAPLGGGRGMGVGAPRRGRSGARSSSRRRSGSSRRRRSSARWRIASLSQRDFAAARGFGEQLRARGERDADDVLLVEADYVLGIAAFWQGEFDAARGHFEAAVARYRPEHRRAHLLRYGLDPKVICLSRLGNTLWFLGHPEAATRARDAALALAEEIGHPYTRATALVFAALLSLEMRDRGRLRAYAALLTAEHGGARDKTDAGRRRGPRAATSTCSTAGRRPASPASSARWTISREAEHAPGMRAQFVRVLLEACAAAGDARTGLAAADRALAIGRRRPPVGGGDPPAARGVPRGARRRRRRGRGRARPRARGRAPPGRAVARAQGRDEPPPPSAGARRRPRRAAGARPAGGILDGLRRRTGHPRPAPGRRPPRPQLSRRPSTTIPSSGTPRGTLRGTPLGDPPVMRRMR